MMVVMSHLMMVYERHDYNGTSFVSVNIPRTLGGNVSASVCTSAGSYRAAGMRQEYRAPGKLYSNKQTHSQ